MYGLAEAVNLLCEKEGIAHATVKRPPQMKWVIALARNCGVCRQYPREIWLAKTRHVTPQSGISSDIGTTPGARLPYGMSQIRLPICKLSPRIMLIIIRHQRHSDARRNHQT